MVSLSAFPLPLTSTPPLEAVRGTGGGKIYPVVVECNGNEIDLYRCRFEFTSGFRIRATKAMVIPSRFTPRPSGRLRTKLTHFARSSRVADAMALVSLNDRLIAQFPPSVARFRTHLVPVQFTFVQSTSRALSRKSPRAAVETSLGPKVTRF